MHFTRHKTTYEVLKQRE